MSVNKGKECKVNILYMRSITNVDWQITSQCNRHCAYCFGPENLEALSFDNVCLVVDKLVQVGTKQIGITGGEPLLHPCFPEIVDYIYEAGLKIYLSTNCDYYEQYSDLIKSKVSVIGIPIDGSYPDLHDGQRGKSSFYSVIHALNDISNSNCMTKVKIGTVITNRNYSDLKFIEKLLLKYADTILYWKLYQLVSYDRNKDNVNHLKPNIVNMEELGSFLGKEKIVNDTLDKRNLSYFFIKPNGNVFIPVLTDVCSREIDLGNLITDDMNTIKKRFFSLVNNEGFMSPFRYMRV